jgi:hypothetical protein
MRNISTPHAEFRPLGRKAGMSCQKSCMRCRKSRLPIRHCWKAGREISTTGQEVLPSFAVVLEDLNAYLLRTIAVTATKGVHTSDAK